MSTIYRNNEEKQQMSDTWHGFIDPTLTKYKDEEKSEASFINNFHENRSNELLEKINEKNALLNSLLGKTSNVCPRNLIENNGVTTPEKKYPITEKDFQENLASIVKHILPAEDVPEKFEEWCYEEQRDWMITEGPAKLKNVPDSIREIASAFVLPGDCGRLSSEKPDWLDMEKFRRGQKFAMDYFNGLCFANMIALYMIFAFKDGLTSLIITRKSDTPYRAFKRYLSTANRLRNWYQTDPWTKGTPAYNDIQTVRKAHLSLRQRLINSTNEELNLVYKVPNPWCPWINVLKSDLTNGCPMYEEYQCLFKIFEDLECKPRGMNQAEMAATQFAFIGLFILYPKEFGVHNATDEDFEAFCHLWKGIGYLLGMQDEYNFCKGTLKEVRQRTRDMIEFYMKPKLRDVTPEWEHMSQCMVTGIQYYFSEGTFEIGFLYLMDLLGIPIPKFRASVDIISRIKCKLIYFTYYYAARLRWVMPYINRMILNGIDRALRFDAAQHEKLEQMSTKTLLDFTST